MILERLAIGTANWCQKYGIQDTQCKDQEEILSFCMMNNIDMIDTAVAYGDCLKKVNSYFSVVTKLRCCDELDESRRYYAILCHNPDEFAKIMPRLRDYKERGICEKIGISIYSRKDINKIYSCDIVQLPYSAFDRRFEDDFAEFKRLGIEIHARSVFLQGLVFTPHKLRADLSSKLVQKLHSLDSVSKSVSTNIFLLTFPLLNRNIDRVVLGVDSLDTLKKNISGLQTLDSLRIEDERILIPYLWEKEDGNMQGLRVREQEQA